MTKNNRPRRKLIEFCLRTNKTMGIITIVKMVKGFIREYEKKYYGKELKFYGQSNG